MVENKQEELIQIKTSVEKMSKFHQVNILKILSSKKDLTINENNNGVFINLSDLDPYVLKELHNYIHYVNEQESDLSQHEIEKEKYKSVFFENHENHDNSGKKVKTILKENKETPMNITSIDNVETVASE